MGFWDRFGNRWRQGVHTTPAPDDPNQVLADFLAGRRGTSEDAASALTRWRPGHGSEANVRRALGDTALAGFTQEGFRLRDAEDANREEALGFLSGQFEQSLQPTMTNQMIQDWHAQDVDQADAAAEENFAALRSMFGGAGITGGGQMAAAGTRVNLARLGQIGASTRNLRMKKAQLDADDNARRWTQGLALGDRMAQGPSDTGLGVLGELAGVQLTREGMEVGKETAKMQADAMKDAADKDLFGSIAGGAIGLLAGL